MDTQRKSFIATLICATLILALALQNVLCAADAPAGGDWPQYLGPTRDGIVPPGPKVLEAWPKEGPKQLWKSETLWPANGGIKANNSHSGCGSVAIAGGRAFVLANFRRDSDKTPKVILTTKELNDLGWMEGVPAELAKKIEEERTHGKGAKLKPGPELENMAKQFVAGLDPEAKKFGPWIERRLKKDNLIPGCCRQFHPEGYIDTVNDDPVIEWSFLEKLAAVRDKEFATVGAMDTALNGALNPWTSASGNAIRVWLNNRSGSYFDAIICLDAETGKVIWRKEFPGGISPHIGTGDVSASSTPAIWEDKCYVAGSAGMYCLSVKDGSVVWQAKGGYSNSSPLVKDGTVYVMVPEATAYDAKTGQVQWTLPINSANSSFTSWASGDKFYLLLNIGGAGVYSFPQGGMYLMDPANGKTLWHNLCLSYSLPVMTGPDTLVMASCARTTVFKISAAKAETLHETKATGDARGEAPLCFQDHIYIAGGCHSDNPLKCVDMKTGEYKWNPHKMAAAESSSPVLIDGKIIALMENDESSLFVVMYKATPEKYEELGRFNPHACCGASPSVAGGKLVLRLQDSVACYELRAQ